MVQQPDVFVGAPPFLGSDPHQFAELVVAQRGVCPQRHHEIELPRIVQHFDQHAKKLGQRDAARVVRDQYQHLLTGEFPCQPVMQGLLDGIGGE